MDEHNQGKRNPPPPHLSGRLHTTTPVPTGPLRCCCLRGITLPLSGTRVGGYNSDLPLHVYIPVEAVRDYIMSHGGEADV